MFLSREYKVLSSAWLQSVLVSVKRKRSLVKILEMKGPQNSKNKMKTPRSYKEVNSREKGNSETQYRPS